MPKADSRGGVGIVVSATDGLQPGVMAGKRPESFRRQVLDLLQNSEAANTIYNLHEKEMRVLRDALKLQLAQTVMCCKTKYHGSAADMCASCTNPNCAETRKLLK